ncbi:MAG: SdrD B-like domain-containing protein [Chitinophagaceae bacterium]
MKYIYLSFLLLFFSFSSYSQISGFAYRDYNGNGARQTTSPNNEPGVPGIIVNAYDASNALLTTTVTGADGSYSMPFTTPVRVEFVIPSGNQCVDQSIDYTGFSGDGNNIRFVNANMSNLNYAIHLPDDYVSNTNPQVYVPIFTNGDPLGGGTSGAQAGFIGYDHNSATVPSNVKSIPQSAMGAVWGGTYSKQAKKIFTSAFLKRQVGLGPLGSGGIYMLEPTATSFNVTSFYDMDANGHRTRAAAGAVAYGSGSSFTVAGGTTITYNGPIDSESGLPEGLGVIGTNVQRGLPAAMDADCYDPAAFDQVGKVGLGDIEISDDGKFLFVMNLYNKKLYRLELDNAYNPTSVIAVNSYSMPAVAVTNGVLRPFAVTYHRNKLYVGAVASGENGGVNSIGGATNLYGYVFEIDNPLGSLTFNASPILTIPLNYRKGYAITTLDANVNAHMWHAWSNNSSNFIVDGFGEFAWSSPMLTNLEFSDRGDLIIDFMDRGGHQYGYNNFTHLNASASALVSRYDVSGDILIAGKSCATGSFLLESNGAYSSNGIPLASPGVGTLEGPGNGEFFNGDIAPDHYHHETSQGAAATLPGSRSLIFTLMDPVTSFSGGTARFNSDNGAATNRTTLYGSNDGAAAKSNGLGDIEIAGIEPPIEVGNLVWTDANMNGIQDAGETGISGVTLELFCDFDNDMIPDGAAIASTTTNGFGQWYFNVSNVIDGDCNTLGNQAGLQPFKTYLVQVAASDWSGGIGIGNLDLHSLTTANAPVTGILDASDNDASLVATIPQIQFTTGNWGENNHTFDLGFIPCNVDAGIALFLDCNTPSGMIGTPAMPGASYVWTPAAGLDNANIAQPIATPSSTTNYTLTVNGFCTDSVLVTVDNTPPTADAGPNQTIYLGSSVQIGTASIVGTTYSWNPATGLDNASIAQPTATPTVPSTTYTVTATGTNGCTETSVVTVDVLLPTPTLVSYPNSQYCFGDNIVLTAYGEPGATFNWTTPGTCTATIDNSVSGQSSVIISDLNSDCLGLYSVTQDLSTFPTSASVSEMIDGAAKPVINFITTACVSNMGEVTVNASGTNLEYNINGGPFQTSNVLTTLPGSAFIVGVKEAGSSCIEFYEGHCVNCSASFACTNPPKDSIVAPEKTCANTPINIVGYFDNASNATWTTSGTGTFATNTSSSSPFATTYTPSAADMLAGNVVITFTTDDPDGAGPCMAAMCSHNMELFNGTVAPTLASNSPVCENSLLYVTASGAEGTITWSGGYTGTGDSIAYPNATVGNSGTYTATASILGCTNVAPSSTSSIAVTVVPTPTLAVNVIGIPEACLGNANGQINVDVSGGSGNYTICYNGNLSNCVNASVANFQWIAPGSYTVTVVDQICPNNVFSYPVVVPAGAVIPPPTVSSNYTACAGEDLVLSGSVVSPATNIIWVNAATNLNATGNPLVIQNATLSMSGNYYAKAIDINGCASSQVGFTVDVFEKPVITHVQVNCFGTTANVTVSATTGTGSLTYSLDGSVYQSSNEFTGITQGNYVVHVMNGTSNCETTLPIYVPNCACPNSPEITIDAPLTSCGLTPIPVSTAFTNVGNATWSSTGSGTFTIASGASPLASVYTPSASDLATGQVNLVVTTDDPDGAGPCTPVSESILIYLVDSLETPSITLNQASYCWGDTLILTSSSPTPIIWTGKGAFYSDSSVGVVNGVTEFLSGYYFATATGNGCTTKIDSVLVDIAPAPILTVTASVVDENCEGHANGEITIDVSGGSGNYTVCDGLFINCAASTGNNTFKWLAPGVYTIFVADQTCPNAQNTITETVQAGLHVDPPTSASYNNPVCVGEDLVLTATGTLGSTYLWTDMTNNYTANGEVIIRTPSELGMSGTYKVQRLDNGCASEAILLDVHIFDNPIIASIDTVCMGSIDSGKITINALVGSGDELEYALNDGAFQTSNVFEYLSNGLYQIKVRPVGSDCEVVVNDVELYCDCHCGKDADITVYPNPNKGKFTVKVQTASENAIVGIALYDLQGRLIYDKSLEARAGQMIHDINIQGFATGAYMIKLNIDGEIYVRPVLIDSK